MATFTLHNSALTAGTLRSDGPFNLGTEFIVNQRIWLLGIRFRHPGSVSQTVQVSVWKAANASGSVGTLQTGPHSITTGTSSGWKNYTLATPVPLFNDYAASLPYLSHFRVIVRATRFVETANYWTTGGGANSYNVGPVTVPNRASALGNMQCSHSTTGSLDWTVIPSSSGQNWWADITFSDVDPRIPKSAAFVMLGGD
jgi:hypothetical protein